jgi:hypothetical protein
MQQAKAHGVHVGEAIATLPTTRVTFGSFLGGFQDGFQLQARVLFYASYCERLKPHPDLASIPGIEGFADIASGSHNKTDLQCV